MENPNRPIPDRNDPAPRPPMSKETGRPTRALTPEEAPDPRLRSDASQKNPYKDRIVAADSAMGRDILDHVTKTPGISFEQLAEELGFDKPEKKLLEGSPTRRLSQTLQALWDAKMIYPISTANPRGLWYPGEAPAE